MNPHQRERHPYPWYQDDTPYLAPREQVAQNEAANRAWLALRLATTPETWGGLLLGQPVAPTALDAPEFARQRRAGLA